MQTPSFQEDHISQIPALQLLTKMGFTYLGPEEALALRENKTTNVLLESVLVEQLKAINSIEYKGQKHAFSEGNIHAAVQALKDIPIQEGYISGCEYVYNLLTLGKAFEQSIEGDKKSFTLRYIDWERPWNNIFHVTEEYAVMRSASKEHYRPDIVLFVNGIPLAIIECKRPDLKEPLHQAISQQLRNQQEDGIRHLYVYSQLSLSIATNQALYATNSTPEKFWAHWEEKFESSKEEQQYRRKLNGLKNTPLGDADKQKLYGERFGYVRRYFDALEQEEVQLTEQDHYLYGLCRPERLLDITFNFVVFDAGEKKIARYQQYFAIKKSLNRIKHIEGGKRKGGVIWHTQGSGKSLTMVMLAQAIALEKDIKNPKIVLVTDRVDLDDQITKTFQKCGEPVFNAATGSDLIRHLESKDDAVITTIINKFESAFHKLDKPFTSPDIFVLIDESHRTQYGTFNVKMQRALPNACFIAFTGTPLMKREKNTSSKFGGIIDKYTVDQAVADGAVVPILYEGRHALQKVNESPIDNYFRMISDPLTDYQKADLKKKFSRADQLNMADQKIYAIAWDISKHYQENWQNTKFKAQLVCQSKEAAIKYKTYLDEIGIVSSEAIMSAPDDREGEDSAYAESSDRVKRFWKSMMEEHGSKKKYEENIISRFKYQEHPEIIIVVDKLLTGFDAPVNTVLYITRSLKEHTLLQAIARVNRVHKGKDFGFVIDYYGITGELDEALTTYSGLEDFDEEDLKGTLTNVREVVKKLPQLHSEVWDIFKEVKNKYDEAAYEEVLRDEAVRSHFYDRVSEFTRILKIALSFMDFLRETPEKEVERYKRDAKFFLNLRISVRQRFSDAIDYKQYEKQIQKLIDKHIHTDEVQVISELVNIFDKEKFAEEVEKVVGEAAKADRIASRTSKYISEKMEEDPAFYKKFSEMLKETIREYEDRRITESEYLRRAQDIKDAVLNHRDSDMPEVLKEREIAQAFYGINLDFFKEKVKDNEKLKHLAAVTALDINEIVQDTVLAKGKPKVDWHTKSKLLGQLSIDIGDYLIDEVRDKYNISLSFGEMDAIAEKCIEIAKIRYRK